MKIGILAVQGGFMEHADLLMRLQVDYVLIRRKSDLIDNRLDGLVLPGGESTAIGKLIRDLDMYDWLRQRIQDGMPVFGTCAGMILLAKRILDSNVSHLAVMDIVVKRNAYGKQLGSFKTTGTFAGIESVPMVFIRAPYIETVSDETEILSVVDHNIVAARERNMLVTSFHPELTSDLRVHKYFIDMVQAYLHQR